MWGSQLPSPGLPWGKAYSADNRMNQFLSPKSIKKGLEMGWLGIRGRGRVWRGQENDNWLVECGRSVKSKSIKTN